MMSGHGANSIFFNRKNKDWTSRTLANPPPPTSDNTSFLPVDVICVSPLSSVYMKNNFFMEKCFLK